MAVPPLSLSHTHSFSATAHYAHQAAACSHRRKRRSFLARLVTRSLLLVANCLDLVPVAMDLAMRMLGPMLVLTCWTIFASMHYIYYWHIVPLHRADVRMFPWLPITALGYCLYGLIMYNHVMAVFTSPGRVPSYLTSTSTSTSTPIDALASAPVTAPVSHYCQPCQRVKPRRAHHCSVCKQCTLRMCHHCPWIWNCVGYHNYRYFFNFLAWLWLGCLYIGALVALPLFAGTGAEGGKGSMLSLLHETPLFMTLLLSSAAWCGLTGMLALHTFFLATNQTTIEYYINSKREREASRQGEAYQNPYDLGWKLNVEAMIGKVAYWPLALLPGGAVMTGDGMTFVQRADYQQCEASQLEQYV